MQLVFCGDFYQLPPVKNRMYNDDGKFCFESELFDQVFPHRITLENVVRQSDSSFIKCVNEAAKGKLSESSVTLLESLKRPLCKDDNDEPIKLYATNEQVDNHNRLRILNKSGQLYEYKAIDRGESHYLKKVLAPPTLWLKDGCPVILVRNISSNLVNGLQGIVLSCKECPVVHFPTVDITTKLEKQTFSVFSPVLKKNVAERTQVPLKLAYALTVHKAQGMTLQRAEIDCHSMFAPGQLGVAIGRVKSPAGLRVINFKREICLPQPPIIEDAMKFCSAPDIDDCSCKFLNIEARWPGSTHDAHIYRASDLCLHLEMHHRQLQDGILLGDSGYPCRPFLLTPYLRPATTNQERYNGAHVKARCVIERAFGW
ncbi:hypothetical protein FSP39_004649 [Pinctada imbricata]|uniref:DNA helicase n=1 Tax=Pinctada imbricata TaxID=66713 RepID=A0AA89CAI0_PINIB|nr:hypothetical protein FSP39_004649 [Pinctada imbricata]